METYFAVTAPGLEMLAAQELVKLGLLEQVVQPAGQEDPTGPGASLPDSLPGLESGGVTFRGDRESLYLANLHLRTAGRVLSRMIDFYARSFPELRQKAGRLPWERYLSPGQPVNLHAACHHSRLYHSDAVARNVAAAIGDRLGRPSPLVKAGVADPGSPPQLIVVRLVEDRCTVSVDSSGEPLHRRGYRLATGKAPLRETLAAAMLLACGWEAASPLLDPFCGTGAIAIEAAMLAFGLAPGRIRRFSFMDWPGFDPQTWQTLLSRSGQRASEAPPVIRASDRDAGSPRQAAENAARAGVAGYIEFTHQSFSSAVSAIPRGSRPGWLITNPPYGIRISQGKDLRNLYAQLGNLMRLHCPAWQAGILCSDRSLLGHTGLNLDTSFSTVNGGVKVWLGRGKVEKPYKI